MIKMTLQQVFIINKDLNMDKNSIEKEILKGTELYFSKIRQIKSKLSIGIYSEYMMKMNDIYDEFNNDVCDNEIIYSASSNEIFINIGTLNLFNEMLPKQKLWYDIIFDKTISEIPVKCMTGVIFEPLDKEMVSHRFKHLELL